MKSSVLDSYAVLAFLFREKGSEKVLELLEKAAESDRVVLIAAPNWAEVRYMVERKVGASQWHETRTKLLGLPVEIVSADQALAELAGDIKVCGKLSLADCFAAALAKQEKADLYTGDPEFRAVEKEIKIIWL
ncbi:MAG: type II toxin-antitoxin system VapC family toxin [Armatimonadetes bacterium]|nr:type II toxin-antitoxin system VapC family toxin [Armatimonadota bacterium]